MKTKHALLLIAFGFCLDFAGGLLKIMHHPRAELLFIMATILKVIGVLLFVYKLITYPRTKNFMNW
jgi:hypothetical protein